MLTSREFLNKVMAMESVMADADLMEKGQAMLDAIEKKSKAKAEKSDTEKASLKIVVESAMVGVAPSTVTEIMKIPAIAENFTSSQKLTHVLRAMITDGVIDNTKEGRKSLYCLK